MYDPGKILLDAALAVALGGDCLTDAGMLRAGPAVFGPVARDLTVCRPIKVLASAGPKALAAIRTTRAHVREHVRGGSAEPVAALLRPANAGSGREPLRMPGQLCRASASAVPLIRGSENQVPY